MNNTRIVSLALAGLAAGGAVWYLFGTEQGRSLRNNIANSAKDIGADIKNRWGDISNKTSDLASNVINKAGDIRKNVSTQPRSTVGSETPTTI